MEIVTDLSCLQGMFITFFIKQAIQFAVKELEIKIIVFDVDQEEIVRWID